MKILKRKILGPVTLLHLMALSASVAAVSGASMLYYSWTLDLSEAITDVTFYKWSDGTTANYLELTYNYYAGVTTEDKNASWGIWNRGASDKTVYLWADNPTMPTTIDNFYVIIKDEDETQITWWTTSDWSNTGEAYAVSWAAAAGKKYTLHVILHATLWPDPFEEIDLRLKTDP
ncbi:MAG: hypothetical protein PVF15_07780 [Candidatus Bathyarchaeota archaeon]|jgi:hypothetical protein